MIKRECDVLVIGAGPAGLSAACAAKEAGAERVTVIERDTNPGGILQQCIHPGFGLKYFGEELTGPEYAGRFIRRAKELGVDFKFGTMATDLHDGMLVGVNTEGVNQIKYGAAVLAMGCRERTRANLMIPGSRPSGVYTAGTAQRLINIYGRKIGKKVVILGSGDIGMIMARRLTMEGAEVKAVIEIMPYLAGLTRNRVQCLNDFGIPLMLSHTITDITGIDRLQSVTVAPVDENRRPIVSESFKIECDTLLLSVGLIPENELSRKAGIKLSGITKGAVVDNLMQTEKDGVFACGNVLHVNDLVDNVSAESERAGKSAAQYAAGQLAEAKTIDVEPAAGIRYVCPQAVREGETEVKLFFRATAPMPASKLVAMSGDKVLAQRKVQRLNPGEMEYIVIPSTAGLTEKITVAAVKA